MLDIQKKAIEQFEQVLIKAGAKYKIILEDGTQYGELDVVEKKVIKRRSNLLPHGTLSNYFKPFVEQIEVGDVVSIPFNSFDPETLRGSVASWAVINLGKGSVTTMLNHKLNQVDVLRLK